MVKNHPYQFAYFNFIGERRAGSFETDYYGLAHKDALEYILKREIQSEKIEICSPNLAGQINRFYFEEKQYAKIIYTDINSCKYLISTPLASKSDNTRYLNKEFSYNDGTKVFSVSVLNNELVIVYKLR